MTSWKYLISFFFYFKIPGHSEQLLKSHKAEMGEVVEDFYIHFTQTYNRLKNKHKEQLQMQQALTRGERKRRSGNKVDTLTTQFEEHQTVVQ